MTPYSSFQPGERLAARLEDHIDASNAGTELDRGYYAWDAGWAWIGPDSSVVLARGDQDLLRVDLRIPGALLADGDATPPRLLVTAGDCLRETIPIDADGALSLRLSLQCPAWPDLRPLEVSLHFNRHAALPHQLDADNRLLGMLVHDVRLEKAGKPPEAAARP